MKIRWSVSLVPPVAACRSFPHLNTHGDYVPSGTEIKSCFKWKIMFNKPVWALMTEIPFLVPSSHRLWASKMNPGPSPIPWCARYLRSRYQDVGTHICINLLHIRHFNFLKWPSNCYHFEYRNKKKPLFLGLLLFISPFFYYLASSIPSFPVLSRVNLVDNCFRLTEFTWGSDEFC